MRGEDVAAAIEWAAGRGRNPGINDAGCFYEADPERLFCGGNWREQIGSRSRRYPTAKALALSVCILSARTGGVTLMARRWPGGAPAPAGMQHRRRRRHGAGGGLPEGSALETSLTPTRVLSERERPEESGGVEDPAFNWSEIINYDRRCFPAPREAFLRAWTAQPGAAALGLRGPAGLQGYGVLCPCRKGFKIGPLFADGPEIAELLFQALCGRAGAGSEVFLDIPEVNPAALALVERHRMQKVFATARMYSGEPPAIDLSRIYGITSFELG